MTDPTDIEGLGFDPVEVRAKYKHERDRRIREDGPAQFLGTDTLNSRFSNVDPYAEGEDRREPKQEEVEVLIIGGGFGGLMAAAELKQHGIEDFRIIETASDFGGTWYWNRYPGAQCDIESYIYLPLLEETGYMPREKYSYQPELYAHVHRMADHFGVRDRAVFRTRVTEMLWDEGAKRWDVKTDRADAFSARFVITATGPAGQPKLPGIPGLETFEGKSFHTSRWDYEYTGGDTTGNLQKLADKRVAVIGTGATAIQVVPHVGKAARQLYVFQRTPSSVDLRGNSPTDASWAKSLKPGWQRERQDNFNAITNREPVEVDLVQDMWTDMFKTYSHRDASPEALTQSMIEAERADMLKMHEIRQRVDALVDDQTAAEALKAWYPRYCKRPTFNDEYLPTYNRDNVTLIDTSDSRGVERITPQGVVVGGKEYEVDCIIFATGFELSSGLEHRLKVRVVGQESVELADRWSTDISTFQGFSAHGFPNWFFLGVGQNGLSPNYTSVVAAQVKHAVYVVNEVRKRGAASIQPTLEAENEWVKKVRSLAGPTVEAFLACTPGYYNNEGQIEEGKGRGLGEIYVPGLNAFNRMQQEWREIGELQGLQLEF